MTFNKDEIIRQQAAEIERLTSEYAEERASHNEHVTQLCEVEKKLKAVEQDRDECKTGAIYWCDYAKALENKLEKAEYHNTALRECLAKIKETYFSTEGTELQRSSMMAKLAMDELDRKDTQGEGGR